MTPLDRRTFLAAAGGAVAAAWLTADPASLLESGARAAWAGRQNPPPPFEYLSAEDAADIEAATAQMIPTDDTPGAREARVVYFIDHALASWRRDERGTYADGLEELRKRARAAGAKTFAALAAMQQHDVIAALEKDRHRFFQALRGATITGMLANPEYRGNHEKLGWKVIGFNDQFSWAPPFGWYDANAR